MKNKGRKWIDDNKAVFIFSLFASFLIWIIVALTDGRNDASKILYDVPVDLSLQSSTFAELGFDPIEIETLTVDVTIRGDRVTINKLTKDDLIATASPLTNVTEQGKYPVRLVPVNSFEGEQISSITYSPDVVQVNFDRLHSRNINVEALVNGFVIPSGEGLVKGTETINPSTVTIKGPQAELDNIEKCIVKVDFDNPIDKTFSGEFPIILLNANGDEIDAKQENLAVNYTEAQYTVEMLKMAALDFKIDFTNEPRSFMKEMLDYRISPTYLEVAGPIDLIDKYKEILLDYIDIRTISPDNNVFEFDVTSVIPDRFNNLENVKKATVTFDTNDLRLSRFSVEEINLLNAPLDLEVSVVGTLDNVEFCGDADIISGMTYRDIVAEIDFSSIELEAGVQQEVPVMFSAPTKGFVWAVGEYHVIVKTDNKIG